MKGIAGRGAWFKAVWAWPNAPLNGVKGIVGRGCDLISIAMNGEHERDYGNGAWPNLN